MAVVVGSFETQARAEQALMRLREAGVGEDEAVMIANATAAVEPTAAAADLTAPSDEPAGPTPTEAAAGPDTDAPPPSTSEKESEGTVNSAALGAAMGLFVGGGIFGPLGMAVGLVAGTGAGLAAALAKRGLTSEEAERSEADVLAGRYLVAVETASRPPEAVRALLEEAGVDQVRVDP